MILFCTFCWLCWQRFVTFDCKSNKWTKYNWFYLTDFLAVPKKWSPSVLTSLQILNHHPTAPVSQPGQESPQWSLLPFLLSFLPSFCLHRLSLLPLDLPLLLRLYLHLRSPLFFHPTASSLLRVTPVQGIRVMHSAPVLTACPSEYTFLSSPCSSSSSALLLLLNTLSFFVFFPSTPAPLLSHLIPPSSHCHLFLAPCNLSLAPSSITHSSCHSSPRHANAPNLNSCPSVFFSF